MSHVAEQILATAYTMPEGSLLSPKEFLHLGSRASVNKTLSRLVQVGLLRQVSHGNYAVPLEGRMAVSSLRSKSMTTKKTHPSWSDVKARLADVDRAGLLGLVQDLYAASKDNKDFLHTRFALGDDPLKPYKATITQWINPADYRKPMSVAKAKKAISDYKKALGQPEGLVELTVFYCEEVFDFLAGCGMDDDGFYDALVRMFETALQYALALPEAQRAPFLARLDRVRQLGQTIGWGVGFSFDHFWAQAGLADV